MKLVTHIPSHAHHWWRPCSRVKGQFWDFSTGSISPFTKVVNSLSLLYLTYPYWACKIRGNSIRIVSVVIVRTTVRIHIAEIIAVVVIRGTLPPISRAMSTELTEWYTEIHPIASVSLFSGAFIFPYNFFVALQNFIYHFELVVNQLPKLLRHVI